MDVKVFIAALVALFVILVALGGVVAFAWNLYIKIMAAITDSATAVHRRLDRIRDSVADIDKRLAVMEDRGES